jgi:hypothetical protein
MIRARKRRRVLTMGLRIGEVAMVGAEQVRRYLAALAGKRAAARAAKKRLEGAARLVKAARRDREAARAAAKKAAAKSAAHVSSG